MGLDIKTLAAAKKYTKEIIYKETSKPAVFYTVNIPASNWSNSYPYINTVSVPGITENTDVKIVGLEHAENASSIQIKSDKKNMGMLISDSPGVKNGEITFKAYQRPTGDITVILEKC